ncbi:MAG: T9SS type A sorting domain-containing protein, partial [candidate division Zixibacteria bacterium]|nr:T9SS type A sorting domain-containing protein [candidate division Zixibacteria bacterium]
LDGDLDNDILGANRIKGLMLWENEGNQGFTEVVIDSTFWGINSVFSADLDNDGDLDILGTSVRRDYVAWLENDGNGGFEKHMIDNDVLWAGDVYAADLDNDDDVDVLVADSEKHQVIWYENGLIPYPVCGADISVVPDSVPVVVQSGSSFWYTGITNNPNNFTVETEVWMKIQREDIDVKFRRFGYYLLNPGDTLSDRIRQYIPQNAPIGEYKFIAYCGDYDEELICDADSFFFTVFESGQDIDNNNWGMNKSWDDWERTPEAVTIKGNYPNPFNDRTTIVYAIPEAGMVNLDVYNLRGQRIAALVDHFQDEGEYRAQWNASNHSSGIYFFKLTSAGKTISKRLTLIR